MSMSIDRPLNACATRLAPSLPTGATTFTGTIRLAARAKYTAEPPSVSTTLPKGPSRVSRATEPATRSCGRSSGTPARPAARRHHMTRVAQIFQEAGHVLVLLDLHPASTELWNSVRVRSGGGDLTEFSRQPGGT